MAIPTLLGKLANEKDMQYLLSNYDVVDGANIFNYMPLKEMQSLQWKYVSNNDLKQSANVIARNSTLPEGDKGSVYTMRGDIPKVGIKFSMDEDELNDYNIAMARIQSEVAAQQLVNEVMDNFIDKAVKAISARVNWMGFQGMSRGKVVLTAANNGGIVADEDVNYSIDKHGRYGNAWTDKTNSHPITIDFAKAVEQGKKLGRRYRYAWMSQATFAAMAATDEVIKMSASLVTNFIGAAYTPSLDAVNSNLKTLPQLGGLQIIVIDELVNVTGTAENPFIDGVVLFTEDANTGYSYWKKSADMMANNSGVFRASNSFVCIKKWAEEDPLVDYTAGVANIFPAFVTCKRALLVDILNSTWNEGGDFNAQ